MQVDGGIDEFLEHCVGVLDESLAQLLPPTELLQAILTAPVPAAAGTREDGTPSTFEILGTCPTQHFTRESAPRPPKPGEPSELEYIASRVFGTREPEAMERIRHGHAVLGAYTNEAGATVMTSGSTDWAHGLAARDPQIEQITRNLLTRLG